MFNNLIELIKSMPTEDICRDYLAKQRWGTGSATCPYCGHGKCYVIEGGKRYKCGSSKCYKRFTVTVGTIFEASNIPLTKWFTAIYLVTAHKRGISSYQLARDISVTQKTAWFILHRIREVLRRKQPVQLGLNAPVEADETFVGGKYSNMHNKKRVPLLQSGDNFANKTTVLGIIERGGDLVATVIPKNDPYKIAMTVSEVVAKKATLMTDGTNMYQRIVSSYNHFSLNHIISEYVRGFAHTNSIEVVFSHFKRSIIGTFFQISPKHTQRYCDEFAAKFNARKIKDADRFTLVLKGCECRLRYNTLVATPAPEQTVIIEGERENKYKGYLQLKDGEIVGHYTSIKKAAIATGLSAPNIHKVLKRKRKTAGGLFGYMRKFDTWQKQLKRKQLQRKVQKTLL